MPDENGVFVVFYAWQSDRPNSHNRTLIGDSLDGAVKRINFDTKLSCKVRIDQDTKGEPGMCDIPATILRKIESCDALVADLTFVAVSKTDDAPARQKKPRYCSNPNVLFELGYAFKSIGPERLIGVMNEEYGPTTEQIFDLDHRRHPIAYRYGGAKNERSDVVNRLSRNLEHAIREVIRFESKNPRQSSLLSVSFFDPETKADLGTTLVLDGVGAFVKDELPDFHGNPSRLSGPAILAIRIATPNPEFYRQKNNRLFLSTCTKPVEFVVTNHGESVLNDARLSILFPCIVDGLETRFFVIDAEDMPDAPKRYRKLGILSDPLAGLNISPRLPQAQLTIEKISDGHCLELWLGKLQPKQVVRSATVRIGCGANATLRLSGTVSADELPQPVQFSLTVECKTEVEGISLAQLESSYPEHECT